MFTRGVERFGDRLDVNGSEGATRRRVDESPYPWFEDRDDACFGLLLVPPGVRERAR